MTATTAETRFDKDYMVGAALLAGGANVIMQLAQPGVGYGVLESKVESGQLHRHPIKRSRTTFSYLAVATLGSDEEKAAYRKAVNTAHAQVRSTPSSPVSYNAFDPGLQLWVAACLYYGFEDTCKAFLGPLPGAEHERLYQSAATLGTTLQVPPDAWPADRAAFEEYWQRSLNSVRIDDTMREFLMEIAEVRFLPKPLPRLMGRFHRFVTTGFLPQVFRDEMRLPWSDRDQRRFDRFIGVVRTLVRLQPPALRRFPYGILLWDVRRRIRTGKPLI